MLRIDVLVDGQASLGEGPLWDVQEQRLYWLDCLGKKIHRCDAVGAGQQSWDVPEHIGSMALRQKGGAIVALRDGFYSFDFAQATAERIADPDPDKPRIRMNDGKVDRQGRFLAGYMDYEEREPLCSLFRLGTDHSVQTLERDIICSNGPCFSLDGRTLYFTDSFRRAIYAYDYASTGAISNKRVFADFDALGLSGFPDGATVDAEDHVWTVEVFRGRLVRLAPDGTMDRCIGLPVENTTSLTFGGADLDIAYVTSMARPINGNYPREREAGAVFAVHGLGVQGVPEPRFAG